MKLIFQILIPYLTIMLLGCQSDPSSNPQSRGDQRIDNVIAAQYYLRYLEPEEALKVEVSFNATKKGTQPKPIMIKSVKFEHQEMKLRSFSAPKTVIRYEFRQHGPYKKNYEFEMEDERFPSFKHSLKLKPITSFSVDGSTIQKTKGFDLSWKGAPLNENQSIVLFFTDEQNRAFNLDLKGPTTSNKVSFSAPQVKDLPTGNLEMSVITKELVLMESDLVRSATETEFYAAPINLKVE